MKENVQKHKTGLQMKYVELEQHDFIDEDVSNEKIEDYLEYIGLFIVEFNRLEHALERSVASLISDRADEVGFQIVSSLDFYNKSKLYATLMKRQLSFFAPSRISLLDELLKRIANLEEVRNIIAHAKWNSLTKDQFVRSSIKTDRKEGYVKFIYFKLTPKIINRICADIIDLVNDIDEFKELNFEEYSRFEDGINNRTNILK